MFSKLKIKIPRNKKKFLNKRIMSPVSLTPSDMNKTSSVSINKKKFDFKIKKQKYKESKNRFKSTENSSKNLNFTHSEAISDFGSGMSNPSS